MKYIKITSDCGYCGCTTEDYVAFDNSTSEDNINEYAADLANENMSGYVHLATSSIYEDDYATETSYQEALECAAEGFWDNVGYDLVEVTEEEWKENNGIMA